jgi:uncharacterized membrane protein
MTSTSSQRMQVRGDAIIATGASGRALRATQCAGIVSLGLLSGGTLAVLVAQGALGASGTAFTEFMQGTAGPFTAILVPLGAVGFIATACSLVFGRHIRAIRMLAGLALVLVAVGMALTILFHLPLNAQILTWSPSAPPSDWSAVHDKWTAVHAVRTVTSIAAFVLVVIAATIRKPR